MPYLGISWAGIWRCYCHNWNQCPQVCLITDFGGRIKIPKFGTKMPYFVIFGLRFEKGIVHIWNQHSGIGLNAKIGVKIKILIIWIKNAWFGCFWFGTWK